MVRKHRFTRGAEAVLAGLMNDLGVKKSGEVINCSLGALRWLVNNLKEGNPIVVRKKTGPVQVQFSDIQALLTKKQSKV